MKYRTLGPSVKLKSKTIKFRIIAVFLHKEHNVIYYDLYSAVRHSKGDPLIHLLHSWATGTTVDF